MKINHLNLSVSDVPQGARFFLGLRCTKTDSRSS